jgi:hypothetical protein
VRTIQDESSLFITPRLNGAWNAPYARWSSVYTKMLVSMKLRTLMQLVAVKAPPLGMPVAFRAQAPKFGDLLVRLVLARQLFQIVAYQLI